MDATGWSVIIGAVGIVLMQVVNTVIAYVREQAKIAREDRIAERVAEVARKQEAATEKLAENTQLTKDGTAQAASAATDAKAAAEKLAHTIDRRLNGDLDKRIAAAVNESTKIMLEALDAHVKQDEENMVEIRNLLVQKFK
jgi:F0F1-type ATP synthase membrane subunit b/b'